MSAYCPGSLNALKRASFVIALALSSAAVGRAQGTLAFAPATTSDQPAFASASTRGWDFFVPSGDQIVVTSLGVFDEAGDGLANSHDVGIWQRDNVTHSETLLVSATVPAGTAATEAAGYRFVSIPPLILPRGVVFTIGALYTANDPDDLVRPRSGLFSGPISHALVYGGRFSDGTTLQYPALSFAVPEGSGQLEFFEANFQFSVVPEPNTLALFGLAGVAFACFRKLR